MCRVCCHCKQQVRRHGTQAMRSAKSSSGPSQCGIFCDSLSDDAGKASYKDTYLAPFARVAPFMAAAGVPNFEVAPAPGGWVRP